MLVDYSISYSFVIITASLLQFQDYERKMILSTESKSAMRYVFLFFLSFTSEENKCLTNFVFLSLVVRSREMVHPEVRIPTDEWSGLHLSKSADFEALRKSEVYFDPAIDIFSKHYGNYSGLSYISEYCFGAVVLLCVVLS